MAAQWRGAEGADLVRKRIGGEFAPMWRRRCHCARLAAKNDRAGSAAGRTGIDGSRYIDHCSGGLMQSRAIHRDEAIARHDRSRASAMRDADLEKSVAGNIERIAGPLNRDWAMTTFAAHQRAEVVMPHRARARPRSRSRRSAIYMSVTTVVMRVTPRGPIPPIGLAACPPTGLAAAMPPPQPSGASGAAALAGDAKASESATARRR